MLSISENAMKVLEKRYLGKDENGRVIEDVEGMFRRVARAVAEADRLYDPAADVLTYSIGYECKITVNATSGATALAIMTGVEREAVWGTGEVVMTRDGWAELYRIDGEDRVCAVRPQGRPW